MVGGYEIFISTNVDKVFFYANSLNYKCNFEVICRCKVSRQYLYIYINEFKGVMHDFILHELRLILTVQI